MREAFHGMARNGAMSAVCVSTVAVCLLVLAVVGLLALNLERTAQVIEAQVEIKLYLEPDLSPAQVESLRETLSRVPGVRETRYVSRDQALADLGQQLGDQAGLLEAVADMNPLPDSIDVPVDPQRLVAVADAAKQLPGVEKVIDKRQVITRLLDVTRAVRILGLGLALLLAGVTVVIVSNTIRLAVFSRRNEVRIMKLVGATDRFIRGPFMVEGILMSLVGACVAAAAVWWGYTWLLGAVGRSLPFLPLLGAQPLLLGLTAGLALMGVVLGALGSSISLRRFLQV
jgi:cell division transport system permease protein